MLNLFDRVVGYFSPRRALERIQARHYLDRLSAASGAANPYWYGKNKVDGVSKIPLPKNLSYQNSAPTGSIEYLRSNSWKLWRENGHCKKIVKQLEAKIVGKGFDPLPKAKKLDGTPFIEFRQRAREIWDSVQSQLDWAGMPGQGGQTFPDMCKSIIRHCALSGECLVRYKPLSDEEQKKFDLHVPLKLQLIHGERIDSTRHDDDTIFGVEFKDDRRTQYWILDRHPADVRKGGSSESKAVPVGELIHQFVGDDFDQARGVPWFAAALNKMENMAEYEYAELLAAAMSACVVLGYRRSTGQTQFGLADVDLDFRPTDMSGNPIENFTPGMVADLGATGDIQVINSERPNSQAGEFLSHITRSEVAGSPGVKASSVTQDYRDASFTSERANDNDIWPEIEDFQYWMVSAVVHPVYVKVIEAAVAEGLFEGIITTGEFNRRKAELLMTDWQGPVARSLNEVDDVTAAKDRVAGLLSSPQREISKHGWGYWLDTLDEIEEFVKQARSRGIPDEAIMAMLGINVQLQTDDGKEASAEDSSAKNGSGKSKKTSKSNGNGRLKSILSAT